MPGTESARLAALKSYHVLDTAPDAKFDDIAALAADLFGAPMALVSLVDDERQWFKARVGIEVGETPREQAFCAHALALAPNTVMVVEDARQDPRFADNPLVTGPPFIRFYAGAVLTDPQGYNLGTLCVLDTRPRPRPTEAELSRLKNLARRVVDQLERLGDARRLVEQQRVLGMVEAMSGVGHWRLDTRTRRASVSDELYRIYGVEPYRGEVTADNLPVILRLSPEEQEASRAVFARAPRDHAGYESERVVRRPDGEERHVFSRGGCEFDDRGEVVAVFGVVQDITERKQAFERLRRSQSRYKLLAENMADVVTRIRMDGSSDYISPAIQRLLGYEPREMAGHLAQAFVYPPDVPLILHAFGELAAGREEATLQHRAQHKDGHPVWVETRLALVRDREGEPQEMVAVIRDISERRLLEAQLSASEARARRVIADAHQAIVSIDEAGRVADWNRFAEATFGWSAADVLGRPLTDLIIPAAHHAAHVAGLRRFVETGESAVVDKRIEVTARRKDGSTFPVELVMSATQGPDGWLFTALMHDISERKAQMEVFETAFTHASIGMALVSPGGRFNKVNQAFCQIVGYSEDEILDLDFQRITHPDDLDADLAQAQRLIAGEIESYTLDKRYIRKDGHEVSVNLAVALVRAPDGQPRHFIAQVQDLTARREVETRYRLLAENVGDIVTMYDQTGRCLYISPSAERSLGYPLAELASGSFLPYVPAYAQDRFRQAVRKVATARPGDTVIHQTPFRHHDGRIVQLEVASRLVADEAGRPVIIAVTRDITARKETERRYRLLAENIADMLVLADLDGRATFVAGASERVTGWTPEEILALRGEVLVHPEDLPQLQQAFKRVGAGEQGLQVRFRSRCKDGSWRWMESHPSLLVEEDGTRGVVDAVHDVTEQVAQEAALADARERAEAANRAKAEFLANMSHELRTPLNGVIGFSRLLAESSDLSEADRHRVLLVRGAGEALNRLINDVLDFSKLEAGAVQLEARPFSVGDMVSEALSMVEPQAAEKAVALKICGDDPGVVIGDKYRLRQVILNFLSNAVKFTERGTVTVRLSTTDLGKGRLRLRAEVVDQGTGIPEDKLPLLFRRFSQADGSITRNYGGTGLGLAISRELIELMGGQVGVETKLGEGSIFWFEVAMARGKAAPRRDKSKSGRASFPGRRVLVVDDVALNRELFLEMVKRHGCEVDLACDGQEAVAAVQRTAYDLVLMDVHMPVMDGMAATQAIRAGGFDALPIVALTASGTPEQVESCLAAGMNSHLLKPLAPQDLERALASAFDAAPPASTTVAPPQEPRKEEARIRSAFVQTMGHAAALKLARLFEAQLAERFLSAEREALQADAHKVGGSADMLGFLDLGEAARRLEAACREGQPYAADLARTQAAKREAEVVLRDWCAALAAVG